MARTQTDADFEALTSPSSNTGRDARQPVTLSLQLLQKIEASLISTRAYCRDNRSAVHLAAQRHQMQSVADECTRDLAVISRMIQRHANATTVTTTRALADHWRDQATAFAGLYEAHAGMTKAYNTNRRIRDLSRQCAQLAGMIAAVIEISSSGALSPSV